MTTQTDRARARLGTVLRGKYRLDKVLGTGGMAAVYRATHRNQAEFALKMLHAELSLHDDIRSRFLREGYAANSVKHPGVVLVVDDDIAEDGAAFLVMELLDGVVCEELWERCELRMPVDAACALVLQLLDVLAAAHAKGIVHRDVKPANVFVTREGVVKVLDFGIARVRDSLAGNANATGTGMVLGTPAFMSPEQALGKTSEIGPHSDLWSVGATFFGLVSGQMVHDADTAPQLLVKLATEVPRRVASVAPWVPEAIGLVIDRALSVKYEERWASAAAMRDGLRDAVKAALNEVPSRAALANLVETLVPRTEEVEATNAASFFPVPAAVSRSQATASRPASSLPVSGGSGGPGVVRLGGSSSPPPNSSLAFAGTAAPPGGPPPALGPLLGPRGARGLLEDSAPTPSAGGVRARLASLGSAGNGFLHGTTSQPLSQESGEAAGSVPPARPARPLLLIAVVAVSLVVGGVVAFRARGTRASGGDDHARSLPAVTATPPVTPAPHVEPPVTETSGALAAPRASASALAPLAPLAPAAPLAPVQASALAGGKRRPGSPLPVADAGVAPGAPAAAAPPAAAPPPFEAPAFTPPPAEAPAAAAPPARAPRPWPDPACTPNFTIDENGEKHLKPECF